MIVFPKLKRKISSFLRKEDGKISKESLVKTGILLSLVGLSLAKTVSSRCMPTLSDDCSTGGCHSAHCNTLTTSFEAATVKATGTHNHSHGNHASHGSHGSHCSVMC